MSINFSLVDWTSGVAIQHSIQNPSRPVFLDVQLSDCSGNIAEVYLEARWPLVQVDGLHSVSENILNGLFTMRYYIYAKWISERTCPYWETWHFYLVGLPSALSLRSYSSKYVHRLTSFAGYFGSRQSTTQRIVCKIKNMLFNILIEHFLVHGMWKPSKPYTHWHLHEISPRHISDCYIMAAYMRAN